MSVHIEQPIKKGRRLRWLAGRRPATRKGSIFFMYRINECALITIGSIILGAIAATLYAFGIIPNFYNQIGVILFIALAFFIAFIALLLFSCMTRHSICAKCICRFGGCLTAGILGSILLPVFAYSVNSGETSVGRIIMAFLVATFLFIMFISVFCLLTCIIKKMWGRNENDSCSCQ